MRENEDQNNSEYGHLLRSMMLYLYEVIGLNDLRCYELLVKKGPQIWKHSRRVIEISFVNVRAFGFVKVRFENIVTTNIFFKISSLHSDAFLHSNVYMYKNFVLKL